MRPEKHKKITTYRPEIKCLRRCVECRAVLPENWPDVYCERCEEYFELPELDK